ncbi:hypothetical protein QVD17_21305 [Tagetes erecta]|uniref:Reverse transcriptase zinc-binding domain-containing protein n=1 Tax=Tagetes erecta TaxID=13708 RepID=A0AAD8NRT5_TARER|nr:hypothetical protein QVD17_21305 [Tagetes erecta]
MKGCVQPVNQPDSLFTNVLPGHVADEMLITRRQIRDAGLSLDLKVADIVQNGQWKWPPLWRDDLSILFETGPPDLSENKVDMLIWKSNFGKEDKFNVKQVYIDLCEQVPDVPWARVVWFSQGIPRHVFHLWLACKERLLTQDRMDRWDGSSDRKCVFCKTQPDSHSHLFFECPFSRRIWDSLCGKALLESYPSDLKSCISNLSNEAMGKSFKSIVQRLMLAAMVYFIWQERNIRLFQEKCRNYEEVCKLIEETVRLKLLGLKIYATGKTIAASKVLSGSCGWVSVFWVGYPWLVLNGLSRLQFDCGICTGIEITKIMAMKRGQDQFLMLFRKGLLTFQIQYIDNYFGTRGWQLLNLNGYNQGQPMYWKIDNQKGELRWTDSHEVKVWFDKDDWISFFCLLIWSKQMDFTLKITNNVEIRVEIFISLSLLKWCCCFEDLRNKFYIFVLQLTFQSQLDWNLVVDASEPGIILADNEYERRKMLGKKDAAYQVENYEGLGINWLMNKQRLTLKSQWPALMEIWSKCYYDHLEGLGCCLLHGNSGVVWANDEGRLGDSRRFSLFLSFLLYSVDFFHCSSSNPFQLRLLIISMSESSNSMGDFSNFHLDPGDPPPNVLSGELYQPSIADSSASLGLKHLIPSTFVSSNHHSSNPPDSNFQAMNLNVMTDVASVWSSQPSESVIDANMGSMSTSLPESVNLNDSGGVSSVRAVNPKGGRVFMSISKNRRLSSSLKDSRGSLSGGDVSMETGIDKDHPSFDSIQKDQCINVASAKQGNSSMPEFVDSVEIEAAMNAFISKTCVDPAFVASAKAFISLHILCPEFEEKYGKLLRGMGSKGNAFKRKGELGTRLDDISIENGDKKARESLVLKEGEEGNFGIDDKGYENIKRLQDNVIKEGVNVAEMKFIKEAALQGKQFEEKKPILPMIWPKFNMGKGDNKDKVLPNLILDKMLKDGCTSFKKVKQEVSKEKVLMKAMADKMLAQKAKIVGIKHINPFTVPNLANAKFEAGKKEGSYMGALKGRTKPVLNEPIEFCPPVVLETGERVAMIEPVFLEKAVVTYKTLLYGFFVGTDVELQFVRFNLYKMWRRFGIMDISTNGSGIFFFKFRTEEGMKAVMKTGPWVVDNIPLCIFKWEMGMNVVREEPESIPIWITLKNLPLELWNTKCICQIASCVGKPMTFDYITTEKCAKRNGVAGFARVLVEVSAKSVLPDCVKAVYPAYGELMGGNISIGIEYQKHPASCKHCGVFGHSFENCKIRPLSDAEKADKEKLKAEVEGQGISMDKGKEVIDEEGFETVASKHKTGRQQRIMNNGGQLNRRYTQAVNGAYKMGRNKGFNGRQWRVVGENNRNEIHDKSNPVKSGDRKQQMKVNGGASSSSKGNDTNSVNVNKGKGIGVEQMRMANRFEVLSVDEVIKENKGNQETVNDVSSDSFNRASAEKKQNKPKVLPPVRTIFTRQVAAAEKLKSDLGTSSDGGTGEMKSMDKDFKSGPLFEKVNPFEVDLYSVARILNKNNPKLLKAQEVEIIDMILKKQIPSKKMLESWTKFQRKFYLQMCDSTNFFKGCNAVVELGEEIDNEVEVDSDNEQAAQDMKVDEVNIGNGVDLKQDTQALGAASSSKCV